MTKKTIYSSLLHVGGTLVPRFIRTDGSFGPAAARPSRPYSYFVGLRPNPNSLRELLVPQFNRIAVLVAVLLVTVTAIAATDDAKTDVEISATASEFSAAPDTSAAASAAPSPAPSPTNAAPAPSTGPNIQGPNSENTSGQNSTADASRPLPNVNGVPQLAQQSSPVPAIAPPPAATVTSAPPSASDSNLGRSLTEGYRISGYFQAQYESHQDSEDQLRQGGALLNQNRFLLRRGRVRIAKDWDYAALLVEFDGNTVRGPAFRWQKAEASLVYGRSQEKDVAPLVQFTMGMFDLPFGYELVESPKSRPFMERSLGGRALWPSEPDVGARLSGQLKFFRYAVALTNGEPLDEKSGLGLQDPNNNKDVTVRLGALTKPTTKVTVSGDVTYNVGKGFHPGTDATKASTSWQDKNHNGSVDPGEIVGNPALSATPSMNFSRWAIGADAQVAFETKIGKSMLYGEIVVAQNLDRGLFISDPVANVGGQNIRQLSYYVAFIQEVTPYGLVGFRTDYYNPDADFLDSRAGQQIPTSQEIRNYSPLVGLVLPDRAKLLFEYDIQSNLLGRDTSGVPAHYPNNQWTLRLQVNL